MSTGSASPPHKKSRTDGMIPVNDAPVNALFVEPNGNGNGESSKSAAQQQQHQQSQQKPVPVQGKKKNRKVKRFLPEPYSPAEVTFRDVRDFLGAEYVDGVLAKEDESEWAPPEELELWNVIELTAGAFTVSGTSPLYSDHVSTWREISKPRG